ncbi:MAG: putative 2OG-Fe(II) oxygenase [Povalibacter sp.]
MTASGNDLTVWASLVRYLESGALELAANEVRGLADRELKAKAWLQLGQCFLNAGDWKAAREAAEHGISETGETRNLRMLLALAAERSGDIEGAADLLSQLATESLDSPQIAAHCARALHSAGRVPQAEALLFDALKRWPAEPQLHVVLSQLRWQRGADLASFDSLRQAIASFPRELKLRLVAADLLRQAGYQEQALKILQDGLNLAPHSGGFLTSIGVVLEGLDRSKEALQYLEAAIARAPEAPVVRRNLIPTLLRLSRGEEALTRCEQLLVQLPDDQELIAYRATALRILSDPRYAELHDYEKFVGVYRPMPPTGFRSIHEFNAALAVALSNLHRSSRRPLAQSLRGGTQTEHDLPRDNPVVNSFFEMIDPHISEYIDKLAEDREHPTCRRKTHGYRIAGSWSVLLESGGFHLNHVHPRGWISSAYYVEIPQTSRESEERKWGWLKFGEPGIRLPALTADHFVRPEPGMLVLFPSYMWHGTVPFETGSRRMTVAFDVVPR